MEWKTLFENDDWLIGAKPPGVSCDRVEQCTGRQWESCWSLFSRQSLAQNTWDLAVICKSEASEKWLRERRKQGDFHLTTAAVVHGKVDPSALLEPLQKAHQDGEVSRISVLGTFRSNQSDHLSLIQIEWAPQSSSASLKLSLNTCGFPVVGKGHNTRRLRSRGCKGTLYATIGIKFPSLEVKNQAKVVIGGTRKEQGCFVECQAREIHLERMVRVCEKEHAAWERTKEERLVEFTESGMDEMNAKEAAESRTLTANVTGKRKFCDLEFQASSNVFVPRKSSSCLVETAFELCERMDNECPDSSAVLDLGCGSGCLLLSLLSRLDKSHWKGIGVDLNQEAISLSKENALQLGLVNRCVIREGDYSSTDFACTLKGYLNQIEASQVSLIICNPPYLPDKVAAQLNLEGPEAAIQAGEDGLRVYSVLARLLGDEGLGLLLAKGAALVLEVPGNRKDRHDMVCGMIEQSSAFKFEGYGRRDFKGMDRCMVFVRKELGFKVREDETVIAEHDAT